MFLAPPGFGGMLVRMLANRNLGWPSSVKVLYLLGGSFPMSAHVIGAVGHGRRELSPRILADFAAVLGISVGDLAAVGGISQPEEELPISPVAADAAALIWDNAT